MKRSSKYLVAISVLASLAATTQATSLYVVGNSLTADSWNFDRLPYVAASAGKTLDGDWQIKSSTGLAGIWANPASYTYTSTVYGTVDHALDARGWDAIALQPYHETVAATRTAIAAMTADACLNPANANTPIYIFESWAPATGMAADGVHYTTNYTAQWARPLTATPEDSSSQTKAFFDALLPEVKKDNPNVRVIPVGSALVNLERAINAGQVHQITNVGDLYRDQLHFDNIGRYFSELVWYSTIFKASPQGDLVPAQDGPDSANWPTDQSISPALAADLQRVAWGTVSTDLRTGVPEPATVLALASAVVLFTRRKR